MLNLKNILLGAAFILSLEAYAYTPSDYQWTSMSKNSSESMPVGGGDIGLNAWAENGNILFYIGRSGCYDENNALLKLGRIRLKVSDTGRSGCPQPDKRVTESDSGRSGCPRPDKRMATSDSESFSQTLHLSDGFCSLKKGDIKVDLWVDVYKPVIHVEIESPESISPEITYESWRHKDRPYRKGEGHQGSWKWSGDKSLKTTADSIFVENGGLTFFHRNPSTTVFDTAVEWQQMDAVKDSIYNPIANLIFGGHLSGKNLKLIRTSEGVYDGTDFKSWTFAPTKTGKKHHFQIVLNTSNTDTDTWKDEIASVEKQVNIQKDKSASRNWWRDFWNRSYINASGDENTSRIARNYTLFRYMLGCNAFGQEPTKFNGGLFTFDPSFVNPELPFTPDFRRWGGGTMTAQNQRLVYWPMLKSGDFDMMKPQFDFYLRMLPTAKLRSRFYWNHDGACFTEQTEQFGLPNLMEYGKKRPEGYDAGVEYNAWLEYEWDTVLEFCDMILQSNLYKGTDITPYKPLIENTLIFFDEHYRMLASQRGRKNLDGDGKLIIFPGSGCETYKMAYNPASTVAALQKVTSDYIERLEANGDTATYRWKALLATIPDVPHRFVEGVETISPARSWERVNNVETPQLYPVWPWRMYDIASGDSVKLEIGRNTYLHDPDALKFRSSTGWKQDNIWAACLGMSDEAYRLASEKFADGSHRFPAFFGPGYDWTPDHNWGGSAMIGLQEMLLQTLGNKIFLFPAWPADRDISFKLHAPGKTTVEAELKNGKVTKLVVTPESRKTDIILNENITL